MTPHQSNRCWKCVLRDYQWIKSSSQRRRHVPDIHLNLISTGKHNDEVYCSTFVNGSWKLSKGSLVVARGNKESSLYLLQAKQRVLPFICDDHCPCCACVTVPQMVCVVFFFLCGAPSSEICVGFLYCLLLWKPCYLISFLRYLLPIILKLVFQQSKPGVSDLQGCLEFAEIS
ncbi:Retrovirus-related Pol polyprotein from transposon TNT 1-94-like protein [Drosera capensis]